MTGSHASHALQHDTLRLFDPSSAALSGEPSLDWTLVDLYWHWFHRTQMATLKAKTVREYNRAFDCYAACCDGSPPPLRLIDDAHCSSVIERLLTFRGRGNLLLAPHTHKKFRTAWQAVASRSGPTRKGRGGLKRGLSLIAEPPWFPPPPVPQTEVRDRYELAEIESLIRAAGAMQRPRIAGLHAPTWWRSLLQLAYYTALRLAPLLALRFSDLSADGCWLRVRPETNKGNKAHQVYLVAEARAAIDRLHHGGRDVIFPWEPQHNLRTLTADLHNLEQAAQVATIPRRAWHGLRRCHSDLVAETSGAATAELSLGHVKTTTAKHYLGCGVLKAALEKLPRLTLYEDRQMQLFA